MILGLLIAMFGAMASAPGMWENLPTCDMRAPILARCREVAGQWGGTDGRIVHDPPGPPSESSEPRVAP